MMPVMSGWTFLEERARLDGCPDLPIVAMSAMFDLGRATSTLRAFGVRECVTKPFDADALLSLVAKLA
jgi:CheY-like chemotaxis protein